MSISQNGVDFQKQNRLPKTVSPSQNSNLVSTTRQQINKYDQQTKSTRNPRLLLYPTTPKPTLHCGVRAPTDNRFQPLPLHSLLCLGIKDSPLGCFFSVRPTPHRARMGKAVCRVSPKGTNTAHPNAAPAVLVQGYVRDGGAARGVSPKGTGAASPRVHPVARGVSPKGTVATAGWTHLPAPLTATLRRSAC